jgi:hypothetical protein
MLLDLAAPADRGRNDSEPQATLAMSSLMRVTSMPS